MKNWLYSLLRRSEQYTGTDMVYFAQNALWVNANTVIVTLLSFALSLLFSHFVSKETYGMYQFLISVSSIIGALTLTGMNTAVSQAVARGFEDVYPRAVKTQLRWSVLPLMVSIATAGYYIWSGNMQIALGIGAMGFVIPITNALNTWGAYLTGKKFFKPSFFYLQITNILYYGGLMVPIFFLPQALPLFIINMSLGLIANLIIYIDIGKRYPPNKENDEEVLLYGKHLSLSNILPMAVFQIDNIVVFHLLGATNLAIYAFASNIPDRFVGLLRAIPAIAFPKFAGKDPREIRTILPKKIIQFFLLSIGGGLVYILIAPFIYHVLFPQYKESLLYSQIYVLAPILSVVGSLAVTALFATRSSKIFKANILNPIVSICLVVVGGLFFGIWGVIAGRIVSNAFTLGISTYFVRKFD